MGRPAVGAVVLINFPFADMKGYKKRPALVVGHSSLDTVILCQITSRQLPGVPGLKLVMTDFQSGSLPITSYIRPDKLFTIDGKIAEANIVGQTNIKLIAKVKSAVKDLFI
jgi:mRNA interferase MazF